MNVIIFLVGVVISFRLEALNLPGWQRPFENAKLTEYNAEGEVIGRSLRKEISMNHRESQGDPSSFTFCEEREPGFLKCSLFLNEPPARLDHCGSIEYVANEVAPINAPADLEPRQLRLIDRRSLPWCDVEEPFHHGWRAELTRPKEGVRFFSGDPEPVFTIMGGGR